MTKNINRPLFITFEGGEGCGKSTQSKLLHEYLQNKGLESILTREIGGTKEAEKIREVLLHNELAPISELLLVMAARFEHVSSVIRPALERGAFVICDRYVDSTASYQGQSSDIGIDKIYKLHAEFIRLLPDITFFIDTPPEIGIARAKGRLEGNNKFEEKELEFHQKVYDNFITLSKKFSSRIHVIKSKDLGVQEIHAKVIKTLSL